MQYGIVDVVSIIKMYQDLIDGKHGSFKMVHFVKIISKHEMIFTKIIFISPPH